MARVDASLYEGLAAFRLALRRFLMFSEAVTAAAGLTSQQYQALLVIKAHADGAIMIRDFAEQMLLQHHGAVQMIDRLVAGGWVERNQSPTDGRSVLVSLTKDASDVLAGLAVEHAKELLAQEPLLAEALKRLRRISRGSAGSGGRRRGERGRENRAPAPSPNGSYAVRGQFRRCQHATSVDLKVTGRRADPDARAVSLRSARRRRCGSGPRCRNRVLRR